MRMTAKEALASVLLVLAACSTRVCLANEYATAAACDSLSTLALPHARITRAQTVQGGTFRPGGFPRTPLKGLPPFCRISITSTPTADSLIHIELWIPLGEAWNGKYLQSGCGGFCGSLNYASLAFSIRRGYAGAVTDDGDEKMSVGSALSLSPFNDGSFALNHPEKVIDFGYRALKETTDDSKRVIAAIRRRGPRLSYFMGCSDGGREALMEAQRFSDDFNGIIVGAPASNWTREMAGGLWNEQALLDEPASHIPLAKLPILSKAVLAQCSKHDTGAPGDALLSDPRDCHFDPTAIQCTRGQNPSACFTPAQVAAIKAIYGGPRDRQTGRMLAPGFPPTGNEDVTWPLWIIGSSREADLNATEAPTLLSMMQRKFGALHFFFANQYFGNFVYQDPKTFDFRTIDISDAIAKAEEGPGKVIDSTDPDLRPFEAHGGKIIQYHGWADGAVTPWTSVDYYNRVNATLFGKSPSHAAKNYQQIESFYRLFMVPGMSHCEGGPGPTVFGNQGSGKPPVIDPEHDVLTALNRWVEDRIAPKELIATHYTANDPAKGVRFQRPLCPYPQVAHYNGRGNSSDAANFTCR